MRVLAGSGRSAYSSAATALHRSDALPFVIPSEAEGPAVFLVCNRSVGNTKRLIELLYREIYLLLLDD